MATKGRLGTARLAANTDTVIYTVPAGLVASININAINMGSTSTTVTLAISTGSTPSAGDYYEMTALAPDGDTIERAGIILSAGESVIARATTATVDVRVHGIEEA